MRKIILLTTIVLFSVGGTVYANKMKIQLKSGNTIVVDYSGTIESVSLVGDTDSIAGMKMHVGEQQVARQKTVESVGEAIDATTVKTTATVEEKKESSPGIKWARPIDDENLKNARSKSRKGWFGSN